MSLLIISQKACRKLGLKEISSLAQGTNSARRCNAAVVQVVKEVLCAHPFSFATEWLELQLIDETPPFGYAFSYQINAECECVVDVRESQDLRAPIIDHEEVRGNKIYTDASPAYARLTMYYEADLGKAKADFLDACAFKLAGEIGPSLARMEEGQTALKNYGLALDMAKLSDTKSNHERKQDPNQTCSILAARGYPGMSAEEEA